ncbi:MAG TPA: reverse transcriptase domain-containing protein [Methylomirabilota bacterium]|nr:reverse transcriptase domain-containing protein [Methylomirabilota bacterium]
MGYRATGLPQGFALSPLLSVITLIVLDELADKGIKYVIYCDDGIFYSDKQIDFLKEAQAVLDKYGIGAYFNTHKSRSVKEDGK